MDPQIISTAAQQANQVGLLTYLVVAITIFCGSIVGFVMITNSKREERLMDFSEKHIALIGDKVDACSKNVDSNMGILTESARFQKKEHEEMLESLKKTSDILISLSTIAKMNVQDVKSQIDRG